MSPLFLVLPWAALCLPLAAAAPPAESDTATAPAAFFTDPDRLLSADPAFAQDCNARLADATARTGVKIHLHLSSAFTPTTPAQRPGTLTGLLAEQMHLDDESLLAVYFAADDRWGLWIGAAQLPRFMGRPGDTPSFTRDGSLHHAKQDLITSALAQTVSAAPASPSDKIKRRVAAMITTLVEKFAPAVTAPAARS